MTVIDTDRDVSRHIPILKANGVVAVGRYYSSGTGKRVTKKEAQAIANAGIKLFVVFEDDGDPPLESGVGTGHAQVALKQAEAIGQPLGSAIYFALEHLPEGYSKADVPGIIDYIKEIVSVFDGRYRVGAYSDGVVCDALLSTGLCDFAWLSASMGFEGSKQFYASGRWALAQQIPLGQNWNGIKIDVNEVKNTFGEFVPSSSRVGSVLELSNIFSLFPNLMGRSQRELTVDLAAKILSSPEVLQYARNIATAIVNGPANHCAATLSSLLVFIGIYPVGAGTGSGDLEPLVVKLAFDLENRRGWTRIALGSRISAGDVGVVLTEQGTHHIYLVVDATNQTVPIIADNQLAGVHARPLAGDPTQNFSPTKYLLRAPN